MSALDEISDLRTVDVSAYDLLMEEYGFFFAAQGSGIWTGLTIDQQERTVNLYKTQLVRVSETMPVQLYWVSMVSQQHFG